ncbi:mandelate racemase/muconate lactonizing enzyme family protein [Candidatus Poribacteria bacterium]|nr:mandelate racemase/muconate lactonizing enzyme family protein [Candidatus Poribacteria bacterium]
MKITDVEAILLKGSQTYQTSADSREAVDQGDWLLLVKVSTDEGLVGWSDVETLAPAAVSIITGQRMGALGFWTLRELLIGEDALDVERLWDKLDIGSADYGRRGIAMQCLSAVDNCLWSIRAQAANMPLCQLLGGRRRERVLAYASTLFRDVPQANAEAARGYIERGFHAVKFGWGLFGEDPARDVENLAAIREALGPERHLLIDPGWYGAGWKGPSRLRSRAENLALCERIAPFHPVWVEDFIHPERFDEYAYIRQHSPVPIAAGEQVATVWDFQRFIDMGCVDIVQPDLTRCGGLTVAKRVAQMVDTANLDLVPHSWLTDLLHGYSLHLIATLPRAKYVEFNVAQSHLTRGVCGGALTLNDDGTVSIPEVPGLGVAVDVEFIEAHRVN